MRPSRDAFIAGDLSMYVGYASELFVIREQNPNLSFDVAVLPQVKNAERKTTFGRMTAFGILRSSPNQALALGLMNSMSTGLLAENISASYALPPALRSAHAKRPADSYISVFYNAALAARGWLDPNAPQSEAIFRTMINDAVSGKTSADESVLSAERALQLLLK